MKPLSVRQEQVLQATVHHYVDTIEPVGSRTLVQRFGIPASSATIRSAMGALGDAVCSHNPILRPVACQAHWATGIT